MPSVRRLRRVGDPPGEPSGPWQARYRDAGGRQRGANFPTKREAREHGLAMEAEIVRGECFDPGRADIRCGDWLTVWARSRVVSRTTAATESSILRLHLRPAFDNASLRRITRLDVQTWVAQLTASGLAPASVTKIYRLFATSMRAAVDEQLLRQSPCRAIALPRGGGDERVFLTLDQVRQLVIHVPTRYQALVAVAYLSGLRWSELAGLRVKRLDLLRSRLDVAEVAQEARGLITFGPPKSRASRRVVTLPPAGVAALAAHLATYPAGRDDLVFTSPRGEVLSRTTFGMRVFRPAAEAAGLDPRPTFHALRHSHVASLIADGVPLVAVQRRIGHGSIRVTYDTYGHLEASVDDQLLEGLQRRGAQLLRGRR